MHSDQRMRLERIQGKLRQCSLDALVTQHPPNLRYAALFSGSTGLAVLTATARPWLLVDPRYITQARAEARGFNILESRVSLDRACAELLGKLGCRRVGFEARRVSMSAFLVLSRQSPSRVEWVEADDLMAGVRAIKDAEETERLRRAAKLTCDMCDVIMPLLVPGACEREIAAECDYQAVKKGASRTSFETIIASGQRSALPHGVASRKRLRAHEFVIMDFGVVLDGYCSDMTRTFYLGHPSRRERRIYSAVQDALESTEAFLRDGITAGQADGTARKVLTRHRLGRYFSHATGHGVGLEVHELPGLRRESRELVREGMVVTVEPGVYIPGWTGVRIEDMVRIQSRGCEVLTPFRHDLICL